MYLNSLRDQRPAWYRDAKWLTGLLLVVVLAATVLVFSLSQITAEAPAQEVLRTVLAFTLVPEGLDGEPRLAGFRQGIEYRPGELFQLLPGVAAFAEAAELEALTAEAARLRIAGELTNLVLAQGLGGALERITDLQLSQQLSAGVEGPVQVVFQVLLEGAMLPAGLEDSSLLANWRQQQAYALGQPVQPVVGVFVLIDPARLETATPRDIGLFVVEGLTETVLAEGLSEAQALVTNQNLSQRLTETVQGEGRTFLASFIATLLIAEEPVLEERLSQVREGLAQPAGGSPVIDGVRVGGDPERLAGLSLREANLLVLGQLSEAIYRQHVEGVRRLAADPQQAVQLEQALVPFGIFTRAQHQRFVRLSWAFGALSLVLFGLLMVFSAGLSRLFNAGFALVAASLLGVVTFLPLSRALQDAAPTTLPNGIHIEGVIGYLFGLVSYVGSSLPDSLVETLARNHLVVMAAGLALIVLFLLVSLFQVLRPRRSRF